MSDKMNLKRHLTLDQKNLLFENEPTKTKQHFHEEAKKNNQNEKEFDFRDRSKLSAVLISSGKEETINIQFLDRLETMILSCEQFMKNNLLIDDFQQNLSHLHKDIFDF